MASATPSAPPASALFDDRGLGEPESWLELGASGSLNRDDGGSLLSTYSKRLGWSFLVRELAKPQTVVQASAVFTSHDVGYFGWMCGDLRSGEYYGAVPETDGSIVFVEGDRDGVDALERYEDLGLEIADGVPISVGLICALTPDHELVVIPTGPKGEPLGVYVEEAEGYNSFDVLGVYGESLSKQFTLSVDDAVAYGAGTRTGAWSLGATGMMTHVPPALSTACVEMPGAKAAPDDGSRSHVHPPGGGQGSRAGPVRGLRRRRSRRRGVPGASRSVRRR